MFLLKTFLNVFLHFVPGGLIRGVLPPLRGHSSPVSGHSSEPSRCFTFVLRLLVFIYVYFKNISGRFFAFSSAWVDQGRIPALEGGVAARLPFLNVVSQPCAYINVKLFDVFFYVFFRLG